MLSFSRLIDEARRLINRSDPPPTADPVAAPVTGVQVVLDEYVGSPPSAQNAIDVLPGWHAAFPPDVVDVSAGAVHFHNDQRILWAVEQFGSLSGRRILELGPLEAGHTYMLEQQEPASIDAIEAHKLSFLRCLIVKELLGMKRARFHLGNFVDYLGTTSDRFDLIVASGVLYHMQDPVKVLDAMARHTDAVYLWTHYVSDADMPEGDSRRGALIGAPEVQHAHGVEVKLYRRSYWGAWKDKSFCGGIHDLHSWMDLDSLMALLTALGLSDIRTAHHEPAHQHGPSMSIFARRPAAA